MNKNKLAVGDRVKKIGQRNYREVIRVWAGVNASLYISLGGVVWIPEAEVEFVIPKGTKVPVPFTKYEPKPVPPPDPAAAVRADLERAVAENRRLTQELINLRREMEISQRWRGEEQQRSEKLYRDNVMLDAKCQRLSRLVHAYIDGKLV